MSSLSVHGSSATYKAASAKKPQKNPLTLFSCLYTIPPSPRRRGLHKPSPWALQREKEQPQRNADVETISALICVHLRLMNGMTTPASLPPVDESRAIRPAPSSANLTQSANSQNGAPAPAELQNPWNQTPEQFVGLSRSTRDGRRPAPQHANAAQPTATQPTATLMLPSVGQRGETSRHNLTSTRLNVSSIAPRRSCRGPQRNREEEDLCRQKRVSRQNSLASKNCRPRHPHRFAV
jgi:hypothetical protein